jgi:hypothetical protein
MAMTFCHNGSSKVQRGASWQHDAVNSTRVCERQVGGVGPTWVRWVGMRTSGEKNNLFSEEMLSKLRFFGTS